MKTIVLDSIGQFIDQVFNLTASSLPNNSGHIFRGVSDEKFQLSSSLYRSCNGRYAYTEKRLLQNFKKYAISIAPHICDSVWSNMVIAQHHGVPTRLLDFSSSPIVALHFALTGNQETDAAVWAVNLSKVHTHFLPLQYKNILKKYDAFAFTLDMFKEMGVTIENYNQDMGDKYFLAIDPPSLDTRIVNQGSILAVLPDLLDPLDNFINKVSCNDIATKFIIPKEKVRLFRVQLDEMNITERVLFNDLDGVAAFLKRKYNY